MTGPTKSEQARLYAEEVESDHPHVAAFLRGLKFGRGAKPETQESDYRKAVAISRWRTERDRTEADESADEKRHRLEISIKQIADEARLTVDALRELDRGGDNRFTKAGIARILRNHN